MFEFLVHLDVPGLLRSKNLDNMSLYKSKLILSCSLNEKFTILYGTWAWDLLSKGFEDEIELIEYWKKKRKKMKAWKVTIMPNIPIH